jgi:hypothetical protein
LTNEVNENVKTINYLYSWRSRHEVHLKNLYDYHIPKLLEHWAINGNRNGIEYRFPLLDKRIIEYMLKVPSKVLFKDGFDRIIMREIGKGIIPDEIRCHDSKNDPVRIDSLYSLLDDVCENLMDEIPVFKYNPDLSFVSFDLLEADILRYKKGEMKGRPGELFTILIFLKNFHEFARSYYNHGSKC